VPEGCVLFPCISAEGVPDGWAWGAFVAVAVACAAVLLVVVPASCVHPARKTPAIRIADTTRMMVIDFFITMISIRCEGFFRFFYEKPSGSLRTFCPFLGFECPRISRMVTDGYIFKS
jgi:hypothetical protein